MYIVQKAKHFHLNTCGSNLSLRKRDDFDTLRDRQNYALELFLLVSRRIEKKNEFHYLLVHL